MESIPRVAATVRSITRIASAALLAALWAGPAVGQEALRGGADVERMVREGQLDALDSRLAGGRTADEKRLLAQAATNRASRTRDPKGRQAAFEQAEKRYERWIEHCEKDAAVDPEKRKADSAAARLELGGMILSRWVAPDLDEHELTSGKRGDVVRLQTVLLKARSAYEKAQADLEPLIRELESGAAGVEERFLTLGIFDSIERMRLDLRFNQAWCNLFVARVDPRNVERKAAALASAERAFKELASQSEGETAARCRLGLGLVQRELRRFAEAEKSFAEALQAGGGFAIEAQVRYEQARCELEQGKFNEARLTLAPLVEKSAETLNEAELPARFYVNLGHLWDANSYLLEAQRLRDQAAGSAAREALERRSESLRESGITRMSRLSARGGPWSSVVALYVAATIKPDADPKTLSPSELLFVARQLSEQKKYRNALVYLNEALSRPKLSAEIEPELLYEIGLNEYQSRQNRPAALAFSQLVEKYKGHPLATDAATYAYELWAVVAEDTKKPEDYLGLSKALTTLVDNFPKHEKREEAAWWLPITLQSAGRFADAARRYAEVPRTSVRWEEAQFRTLLCRRQQYEAAAAELTPIQREQAVESLASELSAYARQSYERADKSRDKSATLRWSASALLSAAELLVSFSEQRAEAAMRLLDGFESRYPGSDLTARALAARISALRALRRFDAAAGVIEQFIKTVPPDQTGDVLTGVARGMLDEADRLEDQGDSVSLRQLAAGAMPTFDQLSRWAAADESRGQLRSAIAFSQVRMQYLADRNSDALAGVEALRKSDPTNGAYQRLYALILTAGLSDNPTPAELAAARDAWATLLSDSKLRNSQPRQYWEARYHFLSLLKREGRRDEVVGAIRQERIWRPELGGPKWKRRFDDLEFGANATRPSAQPDGGEAPMNESDAARSPESTP